MTEKRVFIFAGWRHSSGAAVNRCLLAAAVLAAVSGCRKAPSSPTVACTLQYGGQSWTTVVRATSDPYRVSPLKIEDAFEFKAVYVAAPADVAVLDLYTYFVLDKGPVILEQIKYRPPFPRNSSGSNGTFTGSHYVYGPDGEELRYSCRWVVP
jgi:hypothetical protein